MTTTTVHKGPEPFWKRFKPLFGAGLLGVAALTAAVAPSLSQQLAAMPGAPNLPPAALVALSVAQSAVIVAVSVATGAALAPRLGLRSHIAERAAQGRPIWPGLRRELPLAGGAGVLGGALTVVLDLVTRPLLPPLKAGAEQTMQALSHTSIASIAGALLYGGITEELLLRWGVMTLLVWIGWRLYQATSRGEHGAPRPVLVWAAIGITSLLFGLGHLPTTAMLYPLTPLVIIRAIMLNGTAGMLFGWLYWRRSLEAAMAAHMSMHIVLTVVNLAAVTLSR